jgi:hypothetical protein
MAAGERHIELGFSPFAPMLMQTYLKAESGP